MLSETAAVLESLAERRETLSVAESLTGGLLVAEFVEVPGASRVLSGGVVAYNTALKATLLGVNVDLLAERGAVDADVARQMAAGVRTALAIDGVVADYGLATTGVAGPDPQDGHEVGTVFVALSGPDGESVLELHLSGDRAEIRAQTVEAAVRMLAGAVLAR